jgi:hypothetical protein
VAPPNNYGPQQIYNVMPFQPIQSYENNMIQSSNAPLLINQGVNYSLEAIECMEDLNGAPEATITKDFEGVLMIDFIYTVSIKGLANRVIFFGKRKGEIFQDSNSFNVKVKYVPHDADYSIFCKNKDFEKRLFDISNDDDSSNDSSGLSIRITNKENDTLFGSIKPCNGCCCYDPDYQIINSQNLMKYRATTDGSQCSYCCCTDCWCANSETKFRILDSTNTQLVGEILRKECNENTKEKITYNIRFPIDATPEDKLLIIFAAISIDLLEFEAVGM